MANIDEKRAPVPGDDGEGKKDTDEAPALPRDAGRKPELEDPKETFDLPQPKRQGDFDAEDDPDLPDLPDRRKADSAVDDLDRA